MRRLRRRSRWPLWLWCSCCAYPESPRSQRKSGASMPRARPRGWPREGTMAQMSLAASRPPVPRCSCTGTANSSWPLSRPGRCCFRESRSPHARSPRWNPACADRGSASLTAAAMIAVLLAITVACVYIGAAVIARHRAQAAADLAALAAAGRLADGANAACAHASAVAHGMQVTVARCAVEELDVVVAVDAPVTLGSTARCRSSWTSGSALSASSHWSRRRPRIRRTRPPLRSAAAGPPVPRRCPHRLRPD